MLNNEHQELKASSKQSQFSTQTILLDHPEIKEYFETYYRTVMPRLANKPAFDSIVLMNEPVYYTYWEEYYLPLFQDGMKKKYGDIKSLNEKWETEYTDFGEIEMPSRVEATAQFYDWRVFNDEVIPNFNKRASRVTKKNGRYEILDVIGPDEYKDGIDNNAYTNYMAYFNLCLT